MNDEYSRIIINESGLLNVRSRDYEKISESLSFRLQNIINIK